MMKLQNTVSTPTAYRWQPLCLPLLMTTFLVACGGGSPSDPSESDSPNLELAESEVETTEEVTPVTEIEIIPEPSPYLIETAKILGNDWNVESPFEETKNNTLLRYNGIKENAIITVDNAGDAITSAMLGLPAGHEGPLAYSNNSYFDHLGMVGDIAGLSEALRLRAIAGYVDQQTYEANCETEGTSALHVTREVSSKDASVAISGENYQIDKFVAIMEYKNCTTSLGQFDGLMKLSGTRNTDASYSMLFALDDVQLKFKNETLNATGLLRESTECAGSRSIHADLLLTHNNKQTLYSDFTWAFEDVTDTICGNLINYPWNKVTGELSISDIGKFDVSTIDVLPFTAAPDYAVSFNNAELVQKLLRPDHTGAAVFNGAQGSQLSILYEPPVVVETAPSPEMPYIHAQISSPGTESPISFYTSTIGFAHGMFMDFSDIDNDGLYGSWETYHEFDPNNPLDADTTLEQIGITPINAYELGLNPSDRSVHLPDVDVSINVELETTVDISANTNKLFAVVAGHSADVRYAATKQYQPFYRLFSATVTGNGDWDYQNLPDTCTLDNEPKTIVCEYSFDINDGRVYRFEGYRIPIAVGEDTNIEVNVTLDERARDRDISNNTAMNSLSYLYTPPVDYQIAVDSHAIGDTETRREITAVITQTELAGASSVVIQAQPTPGITVVEAELISTGDQPLVSRCNIDTTITCIMEDVYSTDELKLSLSYIFNELNDQSIKWQLVPDANDLDPNNNQHTTLLNAVQSTAPLQAMIDAAADDSIVALPPGKFSGTLNLQFRRIHLQGAPGDDPTILESHIASEPIFIRGSDYLTISNLTLRTTGGLIVDGFDENLTIRDSIIEPVEGKPHSIDTLFDSASYRILNSTIRNFGLGDENSCQSLLHQEGLDGGYWTKIYLERNLIIDNDCNQIIFVNSEAPIYHYLNNNTFINNPSIINITTENYDRGLYLINNIIENAQSLLKLPDSAFLSPRYGETGLYSSRNLLWNSERVAFLTGSLLNRPGVGIGKTDFNVDPLYANQSMQDYRPAFNSPLIDSGDQPTEYDWTFDDYRNEDKIPGEDDKIKAIDGLLDGQILFDIGAFEFDPGQ